VFEFLLWRHMPEKTLIQYQAGLLDKERSEMLEAHLLLCPTCQLQWENVSRPAAASSLPQFCETHSSEDEGLPKDLTAAGAGVTSGVVSGAFSTPAWAQALWSRQ